MNNVLSISNRQSPGQSSTWVERYGKKHRPIRVRSFPGDIVPPKKVRIYARGDWFLLQFWDPSQKRTLSERIDGDLITAIAKAREIDQRLVNFKRSGSVAAYRHDELAARYLNDLEQRCAAGEIDASTIERYGSAIRCHYLPFCALNETQRFPTIEKVNREFQLAFSAYLRTTLVSANGHKNSRLATMKESGQEYTRNVVRAMYAWAADPQRGNMLPQGFSNPFTGRKRSSTSVTPNRISTLDINLQMAIELINSCDSFQLPIFGALMLYGLRPGELGWMFHEEIDTQWVQVQCKPELDYYTKGRQDKKFPFVADLLPVSHGLQGAVAKGLVFRNRKVPLIHHESDSLDEVTKRYSSELANCRPKSRKDQRRVRNQIIRSQGQLNYDHIKREFGELARELNWPEQATLKDFRHLFSTCLEEAGVPDFFRKYLMGHSFARSPIAAYTHVTEDKLRQHYLRAVDTEFSDIVFAVKQRHRELAMKNDRIS